MTALHRAAVGGVLAAVALLAGCASSPDDVPASTAPSTLTVVATTNVWGSVASAVAGPDAHVTSIIDDPAADPHSYESTPADAAAIGRADLVVANGGGYDPFVDEVTGADPAAKARTIEAFALRGDQADDNEHVWFDPTTVKAVAQQVAQRLSRAEPQEAAGLQQRAQALTARVDRIAQQTAAIGAARPGAEVMSTEPVAHHLLRTAGVQDVTPRDFVVAVENDSDPSAASLQQVRTALTTHQVTALVVNPQTETPVVTGLRDTASGSGVPVVQVTETLPAGVPDYLTWVERTRQALAAAVGAAA